MPERPDSTELSERVQGILEQKDAAERVRAAIEGGRLSKEAMLAVIRIVYPDAPACSVFDRVACKAQIELWKLTTPWPLEDPATTDIVDDKQVRRQQWVRILPSPLYQEFEGVMDTFTDEWDTTAKTFEPLKPDWGRFHFGWAAKPVPAGAGEAICPALQMQAAFKPPKHGILPPEWADSGEDLTDEQHEALMSAMERQRANNDARIREGHDIISRLRKR